MLYEIPDPQMDYIYRMLLTRPMGEVEAIVLNIRRQAQPEQQPAPVNGNGTAQGSEASH